NHMEVARGVLPRIGNRAGPQQLIVLAHEAMNLADWQSALEFVDQGLRLNMRPTLRAEVLRYKGRILFMSQQQQDGRRAFEEALRAIFDVGWYGIDGQRANIVSDWLVGEVILGDCGAADDRARQFMDFIGRPNVPQPVRLGLTQMLRSQLLDSQP